ncbi:MAG: hypothetical protein Q8J64_03145 [Thermodesulfovibrionales bacterium]|nr:hypothetical protein [Thermodesulfovibrionales bacterium]
MKEYRPVNPKKLKRYSLKDRPSKVEVSYLSSPYKKGDTFRRFLSSLPDILGSKDFKAVTGAIVRARKNGRPVVLGMGAHPIKVGLSPIIIDLVEKGIITAVSTNGACIVHDFELSYAGRTSEDVCEGLCTGMFGMVEETGKYINKAVNSGVKKGLGIGASMGAFIDKGKFKHRELSIFRAGYLKAIPMTVHVALGADIVHMHPEADGSAIGKGSMRDFLLLASVLGDLEGGVYINLGSAVVMPEVFLKALTMARNLGGKTENITTVNMDFIQHYRPRENVLKRPTALRGSSYALTGHHEIMFPLLAAAVIESLYMPSD